MALEHEHPWLNVLARNSGFRRALIVHENVNDVFYSRERQDSLPIVDTVAGVLKRRGFDEVVVWDRFGGTQNVTEEVREAMRREAVSQENAGRQAPGEDYDMGEPGTPQLPGQPRRQHTRTPRTSSLSCTITSSTQASAGMPLSSTGRTTSSGARMP